jgi:hypothetical protein
VKAIFEHKFALYNFFFDAFALTGVFFLAWDPSRLLAFYWIDICVQLLLFIFYMRWLGHLRMVFKFIVTVSVAIGIMTIYLIMILNLSLFTSNDSMRGLEAAERLFKPYYEISFFLVLSTLSNVSFYKKLRRPETRTSDIEFFTDLNIGLSLIMIPCILLLTSLLFIFTLNTKVSLIISILLLRNRQDNWRSKNIKRYC